MPNIDTTNDRAGFSSIILHVEAVDYIVKSVNYSDGVTRTKIEGNSRMALGYSEGQYSADAATMEMYLDDYDLLVDNLKDEYYTKSFTITVAYVSNGKTRTDTLVQCRMAKTARNNASGGDALTRTLDIDVLYIKNNGKNPLPAAQMPTGTK